MSATEEQRFNDDLLLTKEDRKKACERFGSFCDVLDFPELRTLFSGYNDRSEHAKKLRRRFGFSAILLGMFALFGASTSLLLHDVEEPLPSIVGGLSALAGVLGVIFGSIGILSAKFKQQWLCNRLMGERLRQFHFQIMVCQIPAMMDQMEYLDARRQSLSAFRLDYEGHLPAKLKAVLDDDAEEDFWLLPLQPRPLADPSYANLDLFFDAYRLLRLQHQLQYANYKLYTDTKLFPQSSIRQRNALRAISVGAIFIIFIVHLVLAFSLTMQSWVAHDSLVHVAVVWVAIIALTARALEEGLQPAREVERYTHYRAEIARLLRRYDEGSEEEKIAIMYETERVVYQEMRGFLKTNEEARFAL